MFFKIQPLKRQHIKKHVNTAASYLQVALLGLVPTHSRFGNLKGWGWESPHTFTVGRGKKMGAESEKTRPGLCTAPERNKAYSTF